MAEAGRVTQGSTAPEEMQTCFLRLSTFQPIKDLRAPVSSLSQAHCQAPGEQDTRLKCSATAELSASGEDESQSPRSFAGDGEGGPLELGACQPNPRDVSSAASQSLWAEQSGGTLVGNSPRQHRRPSFPLHVLGFDLLPQMTRFLAPFLLPPFFSKLLV